MSGSREACPRCRIALDDNSRTVAWTTADQADFDAELADVRRRTGRRIVIGVVAGLLGLGAVTAALVLQSSLWNARRSSQPAPAALAATAETVRRSLPSVQDPPAPPPAPPIEDWWVPPASPRQKIEVLAYAFSGIDEHYLGAAFTEDLEPIAGAPHIFEERPPRHVRRDEIGKHLLRSWDGSSLDAGIRFLFIGIGSTQKDGHDRTIFHSRDVEEIAELDESARMRRPPPSAMFYLSAVHLGSCVDFVIDGDYAETGKKLSLLFGPESASLQDVNSSGSYDISVQGLGVRDTTGDGIWAMTIKDVARSYRSKSAPIELVFTTIPGRVYHLKQEAVPVAVLDERGKVLEDGGYSTWTIPHGGRYRFVGTSRPNGLGVAWSEGVECDLVTRPGAEYKSLDMTCTVPSNAAFQVSNPTTWGLGDAETMNLYLAKLP